MASLGRRLKSLEARISPDRPKLIFIVPYVDPAEPISGFTATVQDKTYTFTGSNVDECLADAQSLLDSKVRASAVELISVSISKP